MDLSSSPGVDRNLVRSIISTARKNYWRMPAWMDLDDLIQEGFVCLARCRVKYPDYAAGHFRASVIQSFNNRITDIVVREAGNRKYRAENPGKRKRAEVAVDTLPERAAENDTFFEASLSLAPAPVQAVLALFNDPAKIELMQGWRTLTNRRLCKLVGTDPRKIDLVASLREYLA